MSKKAEKHATIKSLPLDKIEALEALLRKGESAPKIVSMIQDDWKLLTDVSFQALKKAVTRYKTDVVSNKIVETLKETGAVKKIEKLLADIDALGELGELIEIQKGRLKAALGKENLTQGLLLSQVSEAVRQLAIMLKQYQEMQFDLGVKQRAPRTITGAVGAPDPTTGTRVFEITESFEKLLTVIDHDVPAVIQ